jgi:2-polyprenyl-6-methoxyphenol hydroxylase-like FAD-dependent oxidoreductase
VLRTRYKCLFGISNLVPFKEKKAMIETHSKGFNIHLFACEEHVVWFFYVKLDKPVDFPDRTYYTDDDAAEMAKQFADQPITENVKFKELWDARVRARLAGLEEGIQSLWHSGRIVLVGDAVHKVRLLPSCPPDRVQVTDSWYRVKMTPNLGFGANNTWESVTVLTDLLSGAIANRESPIPKKDAYSVDSVAGLDRLFSEYQKQRYTRANRYCNVMAAITSGAAWETKFDQVITWLQGFSFFQKLLGMVLKWLAKGAPRGLKLGNTSITSS